MISLNTGGYRTLRLNRDPVFLLTEAVSTIDKITEKMSRPLLQTLLDCRTCAAAFFF